MKPNEISHTLCFTGKRPQFLPWGYDETAPACIELKGRLEGAVRRALEEGFRHFITGMAQGVDLWAAEAVLQLRSQTPGVTLEAAIPCRNQSAGWPSSLRVRYQKVLDQCDVVTYVSEAYTPYCMAKRNRYMVDHAAAVVAVDNHTGGGTKQTIDYAMKKGKRVILLEI